jgi:hypothetical protein
MDADRAARQIIDAMKSGEVEITLTAPARIAAATDALFPEFTGRLLAAANRVLPGPGGIGQRVAKGKDSTSAVSPSLLTVMSERAATRNNEVR